MTATSKCVTHHYACDCREAMFTDLQDEVGRLKDENALLREALDDKNKAFELMSECAEIFRKKADMYRDTLETISGCPDVLIKKVCPAYHSHSAYERLAIDALTSQTPPESADECKHPRIYTAQDGHRFCDECEAYLGEESPTQACEPKIKAPPTKEQL